MYFHKITIDLLEIQLDLEVQLMHLVLIMYLLLMELLILVIQIGFTITVGKINSSGIVGDTTNYYYFQSSDVATSGNINGGGDGCTAGPVNLQG